MAGQLDLINTALAHLGQERLEDDLTADPPSRQLRVALALLPSLTEVALRKHPWLCATRYRTLSPIQEAPANPLYASAYGLPDNTLRLWLLETCSPFERGTLETVDGGAVTATSQVVFCNATVALKAKTIERIGVELFDASLFDAMGFALAARMAGPLKCDMAKGSEMRTLAERAFAEAVTHETSEFGNQEPEFGSSWIEARGGGWAGGGDGGGRSWL